eukprot:369811_1
MAKLLYSLIAGGGTPLIEANLGSGSNKYVRACRKILKKIARNELRRPDGMATLLSGSFAYNYIHGCDPDENNSTLDSLVFLCVTEALPYAATPSETREAAFRFLSSIRRNFLEHFRGDLNVLLKATSANNLSDTASIDSSQIFSIDQKMKSDLRMFSASMKDQMANIGNDDVDSGSDQFNQMISIGNDDDEKSKTQNKTHGYTDLRSNPPPTGSNIYNKKSGTKFDQIIGNIEKVKDSVQGNIQMAIDRHESMALLQSKTDRLADESLSFRNRSRTLHYRYCRDLYKQRCVIVCVIIFVIYLLSAMICGWGWQSCG